MSVSDFSVGDIVVVRDWDDMADEFGVDVDGDIMSRFYFVSEMKWTCGMRCVVASVSDFGQIILDSLDDYGYRTPIDHSFSGDVLIRESDEFDFPDLSSEDFYFILKRGGEQFAYQRN